MSFIADMTQVGEAPPMFAVGWLHPNHKYTCGAVPAEFSKRLKIFARQWPQSTKAFGWGAKAGFHTCEFCNEALGTGEFGVPDRGRRFFAPVMIAHYVERHDYAPPAEFVAAVLASPLPGTKGYTEAVSRFTS
jgi:hypothetical protein